TFFTAQHTVAILLALLNKVVQHHNWMMEGRWRTGDKEGESIPLRDRTVGFLGYGAVNSKVHKLLSGFDIEFCILKRDWNKSPGKLPTFAKPYDTDHLPQFLIDSDILIVGVPQTSTTTGMIGSKELELLGENGIVVNVSRGPVIDEESLFIALQDEKILGAAIDVWYEYRPEEDGDGKKYPWHYPFHELDNVVLSPHRAASPMGDLRRWNEVIENISRLAEGRDDLLNLVDLDLEY
ncbi:MAG TPA: NAD(P)-dependent oxidoreductase, partial [bacterium]